ncbi:MAG: flagellar hook-associated protein FlgL [Methylococcaceae bacterium]
MRISTSWSQQLSVNAMQSQQAKMSKTQLQLSSGLKNLTPSDDPIAITKGLDLTATLNKTTQYQENINAARTTNTLESSALSNAMDVLQNARDLAVQGLNSGVLKDSDKQALGHQMQQALNNMVSLANTTHANGDYIFSGYQTKTPPFKQDASSIPPTFVYQGDANQKLLQVSPDRQVADSDPGSDVFAYNSAVDGTPQNIFNTLSTLADALSNPTAATYDTTVKNALTDLDAGLQKISNTQAKSGSRLKALDDQEGQNEKLLLDTKSTLSNVQDLDYAQAISQYSQQEMVLQAAQQSFSKIQKLSLFNYL